jgi:hypothetical protein
MVQLVASLVHNDELMFDPIDFDDYACFEQGHLNNLHFNAFTQKEAGKYIAYNAGQKSSDRTLKIKYMIPYVMQKSLNANFTITQKKMQYPEYKNVYPLLFFKEINPPPPKYC